MALVQTNFATSASGTSQAGTFASAVGAGDLLVGFAWCNGIGVTATVSDTINGAYTRIQGPLTIGGAQLMWLFFIGASAAGATNTITASFSGTVNNPVVGWAEFSGGTKFLDGTGTNTGTGTAMSLNCTTTKASDLLVGWFANSAFVAVAVAGGATILFSDGGNIFLSEFATGGTAGTQTLSATNASSSAWGAQIAAFSTVKPSGTLGSSGIGFSPVYKAIGIY